MSTLLNHAIIDRCPNCGREVKAEHPQDMWFDNEHRVFMRVCLPCKKTGDKQ